MNTQTLYLLFSAVDIYLAWIVVHRLAFDQRFCRPADRIGEYFFYRFTGFLLLGVLAYGVARYWLGFERAEIGIGFTLGILSKQILLGAAIVLPGLMLWIGPRKQNLWQNPKIRAKYWSWTLVVLNTLSWIIFLFAYEFFFRGFLLFPCIEQVGLFWAIVINVILYTLAHAGQGLPMMIGAAIFAVVLSLVSYYTGSFYTAFLIHVINACANDWISLYHHPEMRVRGLI